MKVEMQAGIKTYTMSALILADKRSVFQPFHCSFFRTSDAEERAKPVKVQNCKRQRR